MLTSSFCIEKGSLPVGNEQGGEPATGGMYNLINLFGLVHTLLVVEEFVVACVLNLVKGFQKFGNGLNVGGGHHRWVPLSL